MKAGEPIWRRPPTPASDRSAGPNRPVKHRPILNDNLGGGFEAFLVEACTNFLAVTKGAVYVCMSSSELHTLQRAFAAAGGK